MNEPTVNYLVGFFAVEGHGKITVETPLTGDGVHDNQELVKILRERFPDEKITRVGSTIEKRASEGSIVRYAPGSTIKQLFAEDSDSCSRHIGRVEFSGQECDIVLRFHRAKNMAGITLLERVSKSAIRFSDQIQGMRLASDIPNIVKNIVGNDGLKLKLWLVESN